MGQKKSSAEPDRTLAQIDREIEQQIEEFAKQRGDVQCYPLLLNARRITPDLVDAIYGDLRTRCTGKAKKLIVIVDSSGGNIDAAYNLAQLFRRYGEEQLDFVVPRWAKSAATLLVCGGDRILMTPVSELGPLDPQITELNPLQGRLEQFSPLHIQSTLELIRDEFEKGSQELAKGLLGRLQFPLTLGSFKKSLDLAERYLKDLLRTRMLRDDENKAGQIAKTLTHEYPDHSFCININEAREIGLTVEELDGEQLETVWKIHQLTREKYDIERRKKQEEMEKKLKELPPELIKQLPSDLVPQSDDNSR